MFPPNSYVETLVPTITVFGGGAFGSDLSHEGEKLSGWISILIRRDTRDDLFLPVKTQQDLQTRH